MTANDNHIDDTVHEADASLAHVTLTDHISEVPEFAAVVADMEKRLDAIGA